MGCNYLKCCIEDGGDEKDYIILRQKRKIYSLEEDIKILKK